MKELAHAGYDGIVFEMQRNPYDVAMLSNPHTGPKNVERLIGEVYKFLMSAPGRSYGVVGQGRELAGYG